LGDMIFQLPTIPSSFSDTYEMANKTAHFRPQSDRNSDSLNSGKDLKSPLKMTLPL